MTSKAYRYALTLVAITVAAPASPLWAQDGGLEGLLAEADTANPRIVAARHSADAFDARIPQAGALPDPMVSLGLMNVPVSNPSLGREMMTMTQLQLSTTLPWPGKRRFRESVARHLSESATWTVEEVRQGVIADVKTAYYELYFIDRAIEVTEANRALLDDFASLTAAKYGVGTAAQTDVLKAQIERTRLSDQLVALEQQRTSGAARLNTLLGRPAGGDFTSPTLIETVRAAALAPVSGASTFSASALTSVLPADERALGSIPGLADLQEMALARNPMIQAQARQVAANESAAELAATATRPDVSVTTGYSYRSGFGDFFNLMVSAPLPIFAGRKQHQGLAERMALVYEHEARQRGVVDQVNEDIARRSADLRRARDQLVLLTDGILPQARSGLASATSAYQVGRVDFLTLLDAQVALYRHELDYHRLLTDFATNLAALERAVGTEVVR